MNTDCPFCGNANPVEIIVQRTAAGFYRVTCCACYAAGPTKGSLHEARVAWATRPTTPKDRP